MTRHRDSPELRHVAAALDIDPDRLAYFAECHPDPTVDVILNLADRPPVDDETRAIIARWLEDFNTKADETPGGDARGLGRRNRGEDE